MNDIGSFAVYNFCPKTPMKDAAVPANNPYKHLTGIELELERVNTHDAPPTWKSIEDRSLRDGREFISAGAFQGLDLKKHVRYFFTAGITCNNSPRTSTHIHINAGDCTVDQVRAMFVISYFLEEALFNVVQADRKHCGYCMPLSEMSPYRIRKFLASDRVEDIDAAMSGKNEDKYYGFNINSIRKHNTVEFRYFPGGPSEQTLLDWIVYCNNVKSAAVNGGLKGVMSLDTPEILKAWLLANFPTWAPILLRAMPEQDMHQLWLEAIAYLPDNEQKQEHRDPLVFITPRLLDYVGVAVINHHKRAQIFRDVMGRLGVVSLEEWRERLVEAQRYPVEDELMEPVRPPQKKVKIDDEWLMPNPEPNPFDMPKPFPGRSANKPVSLKAMGQSYAVMNDDFAAQYKKMADYIRQQIPAPRGNNEENA